MPLPDIATVDRQQAPSEWPVLHLSQYTDASEQVSLTEGCDADVVDLTNAFQVMFYAKDHLLNQDIYIEQEAAIVGAPTDGVVQLDIAAASLNYPGVFYGEIALFEEDPDNLGNPKAYPYKRLPMYLEVTQGLNAAAPANNYGLRVSDIRMALWDRCPEDNFLLEAVMWSDAQIIYAIQRPIDKWNETPPIIPPTYSASDFPHRYHWTNAAIAELYMMAAHNYLRNSLTYQAHGVTVGDKDKFQYYRAMGKEMQAEYEEWLGRTKAAQNAMNAMGSCGLSHYG